MKNSILSFNTINSRIAKKIGLGFQQNAVSFSWKEQIRFLEEVRTFLLNIASQSSANNWRTEIFTKLAAAKRLAVRFKGGISDNRSSEKGH